MSRDMSSIYKEEYTRDAFQLEVSVGDRISVCTTSSITESSWPEYFFEGFDTCQYQYGHGCANCKGKVRMSGVRTGHKQSICATNQRRQNTALISIRWNKNFFPEELFEI